MAQGAGLFEKRKESYGKENWDSFIERDLDSLHCLVKNSISQPSANQRLGSGFLPDSVLLQEIVMNDRCLTEFRWLNEPPQAAWYRPQIRDETARNSDSESIGEAEHVFLRQSIQSPSRVVCPV